MSLCVGRGKNVTSQKPKRIRDRIAFLSVFTKSLGAEDALEFIYPRGLVSDEWFLYLVNRQNNLDSMEKKTLIPGLHPRSSGSVGLGWGPRICIFNEFPQVILNLSQDWKSSCLLTLEFPYSSLILQGEIQVISEVAQPLSKPICHLIVRVWPKEPLISSATWVTCTVW